MAVLPLPVVIGVFPVLEVYDSAYIQMRYTAQSRYFEIPVAEGTGTGEQDSIIFIKYSVEMSSVGRGYH